MTSFLKNYELFDNVQLTWKQLADIVMINDPKMGDLCARLTPINATQTVVVRGTYTCRFRACIHATFVLVFMPFHACIHALSCFISCFCHAMLMLALYITFHSGARERGELSETDERHLYRMWYTSESVVFLFASSTCTSESLSESLPIYLSYLSASL